MVIGELVKMMEEEVRESALDLIKHAVRVNKQSCISSDYIKEELVFARGARKLIGYNTLDGEDKEQVDYFDANLMVN